MSGCFIFDLTGLNKSGIVFEMLNDFKGLAKTYDFPAALIYLSALRFSAFALTEPLRFLLKFAKM